MSDGLILLGRRVCRPRPLCPECEVADICRYPFKTGGLAPLDLTAKPVGSPRSRKAPRVQPSTATQAESSKAQGRRPKARGGTPPKAAKA
jgi:hypothetical protein